MIHLQDVYEYVFCQSEMMDNFGIFSSFPRKRISPEQSVSDLQGVLTVEEEEEEGFGFDPTTLVSLTCVVG